MKYFRKKFRFRRRTSYRRKYIRKFPRPGTKRFFRKQRRVPRPEIKWMDFSTDNDTMSTSATHFATRIQPVTLGTGTSVNTRIGKEIKTRRAMCKFTIQSLYFQPASGEANYDTPVRVVFWTPVTTATLALAYMNGTTPFAVGQQIESTFDWNIIRVHRDMNFRMGQSMFVPLADIADGFANTSAPHFIYKSVTIPFPRNVTFPQGDTIDPDRYVIYMSIFKKINTFPINLDLQCKTTFIDA